MNELENFLFFENVVDDDLTKEDMLEKLAEIKDTLELYMDLPEEIRERIIELCESVDEYSSRSKIEDVVREVEELIEMYV